LGGRTARTERAGGVEGSRRTATSFERFVGSVAALEELDPAALTAVAAEHDVEVLGPPGMLA